MPHFVLSQESNNVAGWRRRSQGWEQQSGRETLKSLHALETGRGITCHKDVCVSAELFVLVPGWLWVPGEGWPWPRWDHISVDQAGVHPEVELMGPCVRRLFWEPDAGERDVHRAFKTPPLERGERSRVSFTRILNIEISVCRNTHVFIWLSAPSHSVCWVCTECFHSPLSDAAREVKSSNKEDPEIMSICSMWSSSPAESHGLSLLPVHPCIIDKALWSDVFFGSGNDYHHTSYPIMWYIRGTVPEKSGNRFDYISPFSREVSH